MNTKLCALAAAAALILAGCTTQPPASGEAAALPPASSSVAQPPAPPPPATAVLVAAGDNLIHDVIYQQAGRRTNGNGYDFAPAYRNIAPLLADADFAFINQETVLAGDIAPLSSYPQFNSPPEVGEELLRLGFNMFSTANNHSYDKWEDGLRANLAFWDSKQGVAVAGTYRDAEEIRHIGYIEKNGIRLALIAATELTNGLRLKAESTAGVVLLSQTALIKELLATASQNADLVVLSLHWGVEGSSVTAASQYELAETFANAGADIILGHHPHVLQGGEFINTARGRSYVVYSLGNFISAQSGAHNMAGGLLRLELEKPTEGQATITAASFIPTITHYGYGFEGLTLYPWADYTPALAAQHGVRAKDSRFSYEYLQAQLEALRY